MNSFADKVIAFNKSLNYKGKLPAGIKIMNPFKENAAVPSISAAFYRKYYNDNNTRYLILGINPGRFGAGLTGIPFTDPRRLQDCCDIAFTGNSAHEPSSVYVYEMIKAFGGIREFYDQFYINSVCPLGFTRVKENGKEINYNYYDSKELAEMTTGFIIKNIRKQIDFGINSKVCFCFGTGKNEQFLKKINEQHHFFKEIIALEHPRYIMQYKAKVKAKYIEKYVKAFKMVR